MEYHLHTHTQTGQGGIGGKDARIMQLGERGYIDKEVNRMVGHAK
jgi:hypothetical protein